MRSTLVITEAADELGLLTAQELRAAAGVTGTTDDTALTEMGLRVAAAIMSECGIAAGVGGEPTLKQETLTQTFWQVDTDDLVLARRHDVVATSITVDGATLSDADFITDPEAGMLTRLCGDTPVRWRAAKIVVVYQAGFEVVPHDLRQCAMDFVHLAWLEKDRDPALKSEVVDIPDVRRTEKAWWVGSVPGQSREGTVPDVVAGQLKRFRNIVIG